MTQFEILLSWGMSELEARREIEAQQPKYENEYNCERHDMIESGDNCAHVVRWWLFLEFGAKTASEAKIHA